MKIAGVIAEYNPFHNGHAHQLASLRQLGVERSVLLTGDRAQAARMIREQAGMDEEYHQLLPEEKLDRVRALRRESSVLAVGDGINDALALAEADVGIAMGAMGSDVAIQSADIALMNNDLENIPYVIALARMTKSIMYQNIAIAFAVSLFMMLLSAVGLIPALAGAFLHNIGAFIVLINSSRILRQGNFLEKAVEKVRDLAVREREDIQAEAEADAAEAEYLARRQARTESQTEAEPEKKPRKKFSLLLKKKK